MPTVANDAASKTLAASNADRLTLRISNHSPVGLNVYLGKASPAFRIAGHDSAEVPAKYKGEVTGKWDVTSVGYAVVDEFVDYAEAIQDLDDRLTIVEGNS